MKPTVYRLKLGVSEVALDSLGQAALLNLWRDDAGPVYHLMVVVNGRDAGCYAGDLDTVEVWFGGWLNGWLAKTSEEET